MVGKQKTYSLPVQEETVRLKHVLIAKIWKKKCFASYKKGP